MTCRCNFHSPFLYHAHPRESMFMADSAFYKGASSGQTMGAIQTQAIARFEEKNGYSAGSIRGISAKGNLLIEESENARKRKRHSASHYRGSK